MNSASQQSLNSPSLPKYTAQYISIRPLILKYPDKPNFDLWGLECVPSPLHLLPSCGGDWVSLTAKGPHAVMPSSSSVLYLQVFFWCKPPPPPHPTPLWHDELAVKSKDLSCSMDWDRVCASVVAATSGIKNCSSGEFFPSCCRWEISSQGSGGKIHILQSMDRDTWRAKDEVETMKTISVGQQC